MAGTWGGVSVVSISLASVFLCYVQIKVLLCISFVLGNQPEVFGQQVTFFFQLK